MIDETEPYRGSRLTEPGGGVEIVLARDERSRRMIVGNGERGATSDQNGLQNITDREQALIGPAVGECRYAPDGATSVADHHGHPFTRKPSQQRRGGLRHVRRSSYPLSIGGVRRAARKLERGGHAGRLSRADTRYERQRARIRDGKCLEISGTVDYLGCQVHLVTLAPPGPQQ